jgi:hypothetical protein
MILDLALSICRLQLAVELVSAQSNSTTNGTTTTNATAMAASNDVVPFVLRRPDAVAGIGAGIMGFGLALMLVLSIICGSGGSDDATPISVSPAPEPRTSSPAGGKVSFVAARTQADINAMLISGGGSCTYWGKMCTLWLRMQLGGHCSCVEFARRICRITRKAGSVLLHCYLHYIPTVSPCNSLTQIYSTNGIAAGEALRRPCSSCMWSRFGWAWRADHSWCWGQPTCMPLITLCCHALHMRVS